MKLRKIIFWLHLCAGVSAGIVVFIMSVTGVALTYQKQMTEWADKSSWPAQTLGPELLPVQTLIDRVRQSKPDAIPSAMVLYSDPAAPASVTIGTGRNVFVNRYTGEVGGEGSAGIRAFFRVMTDWHRYVGAATENRPMGKAVTGASNLVFLGIVISGMYLWWPRTWTRQSFRSVTWFKRGTAGKARDFNWHNTLGFWLALPLFFVVISATVISYPWASNLVYRLAGVEPPRPASAQTARPQSPQRPVLDLAPVDTLIKNAQNHVSNWRSMNVRLPSDRETEVTFTVDEGWGGQPQLRTTLVLDKASGDVNRSQSFKDQNAGQRARSWLRFVHTGEFYGMVGQTIAGIASLSGAMLVYTGLALSFRRCRAWIGRRRREELTPAARVLEKEYTA